MRIQPTDLWHISKCLLCCSSYQHNNTRYFAHKDERWKNNLSMNHRPYWPSMNSKAPTSHYFDYFSDFISESWQSRISFSTPLTVPSHCNIDLYLPVTNNTAVLDVFVDIFFFIAIHSILDDNTYPPSCSELYHQTTRIQCH